MNSLTPWLTSILQTWSLLRRYYATVLLVTLEPDDVPDG
jgi:hypothetical protein